MTHSLACTIYLKRFAGLITEFSKFLRLDMAAKIDELWTLFCLHYHHEPMQV